MTEESLKMNTVSIIGHIFKRIVIINVFAYSNLLF